MSEEEKPKPLVWEGPGLSPFCGPSPELWKMLREIKAKKAKEDDDK